jgi:hypothetical protein
MNETQLHLAWLTASFSRRFHTAVSLHSHTMHSQEGLEFLPRIAAGIPIVRETVAFQERCYERKHGHPPNYASAYWTPPLSEREALRLEEEQIENVLGLQPIVSLSDHDNIDAAMHLHLLPESQTAPVSVEWTVPCGPTFFHLGVHNLPRDNARGWMDALAGFTSQPVAERLRELLAALNELPGVLLVFNHPLWDEKGLGMGIHRQLVDEFLSAYGCWIHALELNGMRCWAENRAVAAVARSWGLCAISGGDRHACEPNSILNLTNASSLEEFIDEIRRDRMSDILVMPRYRDSFYLRYTEAIWDIVREYPGQTGRERWTDRCFHRTPTGQNVPLSQVWGGDGPGIIGTFVAFMRVISCRQVRSTLRMLALRAGGEVLP